MTLQEQARALGDPTRHGVFRYLADAERPVDVAELTSHFELNHNAIRQHLAKLVDAELVVESTAPASGRGRPRLRYEVAPGVDSRWGVEGPYERLARWLAEMVRTGDTPVEVGRRAGRSQRLGGRSDDDPVAVLVGEMARQGFDPTLARRDDAIDITLTTCPFASTALADPGTVCQLHFGMAQGIAEGLAGVEVDELVPNDPRHANCHLRGRAEQPRG
jgi:predicted ArsR family transcriptional regulator